MATEHQERALNALATAHVDLEEVKKQHETNLNDGQELAATLRKLEADIAEAEGKAKGNASESVRVANMKQQYVDASKDVTIVHGAIKKSAKLVEHYANLVEFADYISAIKGHEGQSETEFQSDLAEFKQELVALVHSFLDSAKVSDRIISDLARRIEKSHREVGLGKIPGVTVRNESIIVTDEDGERVYTSRRAGAAKDAVSEIVQQWDDEERQRMRDAQLESQAAMRAEHERQQQLAKEAFEFQGKVLQHQVENG